MRKLFFLDSDTEDEETLEMFHKYWETNEEGSFKVKVPDLAEKYELSGYELRETINKHCHCLSTIFKCPKCGKPKKYRSRSKLKRDEKRLRWAGYNKSDEDISYLNERIEQDLCSKCKEKQRIKREIRKENLKEERKELIKKHYHVHEKPTLDKQSIDLEDAIYITALFREGADENLERIRPVNSFENSLAPTKELTISIINTLFYKKFISIHPDSNLNAFQFVNGAVSKPEIFEVSWEPTFKFSGDSIVDNVITLEKTLEKSEFPESWLYQIEPLWRVVAYAEILEFLIHLLDTHNLPFSPGKRTAKVIMFLIEDFSPLDITFMIWASLQTTLSFLARGNASKQVAASYLLSCVETYAEDVKNREKKIGKFNRNSKCPISVVANILYKKVLKMDGFRKVPKI